MSSKRYVPNRLRGVLGGDDASGSSGRVTSSRGKGRKSRPWRVDAASWKQQLQERKAVYDNFALQEKAEEEKESSSQIPEKEEFESIPLNVLTSTNAEGGGRVETMLTPRGGGQVETVFTPSTPTTSSSSQPLSSPSSQKMNNRSDDYGTSTHEDSGSASSSKSSSSSPSKKMSPRRPSPLPRNRSRKNRKGKKSPSKSSKASPGRTKHVDDFNYKNYSSDDGSEDWVDDEEVVSTRSAESNGSREFYIDVAELATAKSKDSSTAIVNGVAHDKIPVKKNKIFKPRTRVRMLRHGDSDDTAESIGFPGGEEDSSSDYPVNKSSMMDAVESFINPSRGDDNSGDRIVAPRNSTFARAGAEIASSESVTRRGGRRRPRASQLSPASSTTSTTGTIMGNSSYNNTDFRGSRSSSGDDGDDNIVGGDDEWSIRPVPSEEDICLEKRRWPLRPDGDTATMASGDTDIVSVTTNDVTFTPNRGEDDMVLRERIALSLSPSKQDKGTVPKSTEKDKTVNESEETPSTMGTTPDPLQKARKTLLLSNLNRSVRSLDISSHSQQDNDTVGDSSIESSYSTSIFVPLRSHQRSSSNRGTAKEIPLNVLNDHGVYVSKYNEKGIYVPPKHDSVQSVTGTPKKYSAKDMYNEHGAYVPQDKAAVMLEDILQSDNVAEGEALSSVKGNPDESVLAEIENSQKVTNIKSGVAVDEEFAEDRGEVNGVPESNEESIDGIFKIEKDDVVADKIDDASKQSEGKPLSNKQLQAESISSKSIDDDEDLLQEDASSFQNVSQEGTNKPTMVESDLDQKLSSPEQQIIEGAGKNEGGDEYEYCAVDEIDANRIRLISDLTRRVSLIYTGNHVCIESIGMSEDPDPLAALDRKRAAIKNTHNVHLKAQLNDTVSALNTDHHHVVESPGKMVSGKGKKWKERMAMKKLSKKNSTDAKKEEKSDLPNIEAVDDGTTHEEGSKDIQSQGNISASALEAENSGGETEEKEGENPVEDLKETDDVAPTGAQDMTEELEIGNEDQPVDKTDEIDPAILDVSSAAPEKMRELSEEENRVNSNSTLSMSGGQKNEDTQSLSTSEKPVEVHANSIENGSETVDSTGVLQEPNGSLMTTKDTNAPAIGENISLTISEESQGNDIDLPTPVNDNNIIQGLPPNKGKKWKDRLKKKKNKKSEKVETTIMDTPENGEGASENPRTATVENMQETVVVSAPNSHDEDSGDNVHSKPRPTFNRNISDLTADEKQRGPSPTNEVQTEPTPKNVGKKSNKWKNRLAKIKGSKQDNAKSIPDEMQDAKPELPSETCEVDSPDTSQVVNTEPDFSDTGQILVDFKKARDASRPEALEPVKHQPLMVSPKTPEHLPKNDMPAPIETSTQPSLLGKQISKSQSPDQNSKMQDPNIHKNLRESFDVFDKFLQKGHTDAVDDESLYTEMTIGQETLLESGLPTAQASEEELSYMDFTIEESIQPSFMGPNTASKIGPTGQKMMSPFMTNLLSSRMFQDDGPAIPMMTLPPKEEQEPEKKNKVIDSPDIENLKQFPTITVGDAHDDDMTQITMGSLEDQNQDENGDEEFFDAESKPFAPSPSPKSRGKRSVNSRKSDGASSNSSPVPCSEASKQRIVEILRKEVWSRDKKVVQSAMEELDSEAKNGHYHRAHIVRCGGVMTIMRAMEMSSDCEAIQIASCSTLEKLALEPQTQIAICEMEGISLIVRSMQVNAENVNLQEAACSALATICRHHEGNSSKDLMKDAEEAVPTLLSCMTRYPTNSCIQAKGFQAIANLCSGSHAHQRLEELSKAGGIMTLTMAIQTPWENKNDQQEAISNLSILLRGITELNEKSSKKTKEDETNAIRNESESPSTEGASMGELESDNATVNSYMEEIPNMPMMSTTSLNCDDIPDLDEYDEYGADVPDLDQYPTMMSNLEWQNFGEDDLDAGRKTSEDPTSPSNDGAQRAAADGAPRTGEEQCTIQ